MIEWRMRKTDKGTYKQYREAHNSLTIFIPDENRKKNYSRPWDVTLSGDHNRKNRRQKLKRIVV